MKKLVLNGHVANFFSNEGLERVLQFFLILQNPPPPKVTKSTFYNISSFLLMLSSSNFFWLDKSIFAFDKQNFFWWKTKNDKRIWIWKIENPKSLYLATLGDFQFFTFNFLFVIFGFPLKKYFSLKQTYSFVSWYHQ